MTFVLLMMGLSWAAKPFVCDPNFWEQTQLEESRTFIDPVHFHQRILRPGLRRVNADICRCLPTLRRKWPSRVKAYLVAEPNRGRTRVEYIIEPSSSVVAGRMLACMGEPSLTFEPIHYVSDIIRPDGSRGEFPRYPIVVAFDGEDARKSRLRKRVDPGEDQ